MRGKGASVPVEKSFAETQPQRQTINIMLTTQFQSKAKQCIGQQ
jgi:hypothetical protein